VAGRASSATSPWNPQNETAPGWHPGTADFATMGAVTGWGLTMRNTHTFIGARASLSLLGLAAVLLLGGEARAQTAGTITFSASPTSGTGSVRPVLTWSTSPVAQSCTASGGWSGSKSTSGTETLASITTTKTFTLNCTWGNGTATVNWTAPTRNTDNSTLTNLSGFKVLYGTSATALTQTKTVSGATARSTTISSLSPATWYFAVRAVNSQNGESDNSSLAQKAITGATSAKSVTVTVAGTPPPSTTLKTTGTRVYDVVRVNDVRTLGRQIGTIARGKPCNPDYRIPNTSYYRVNSADVTVTRAPRSTSLVATCGPA
jgi:hypothetical protein